MSESEHSQVLAQLAAKEWEALEVIRADLCQWLASVLQLDRVNGVNFMDTLDTGVQLCTLAGLIQQGASKAEGKGVVLRFKVPMEPLNCSHKASISQTSSFYARDNASNFISWCRDLGVEEAVIFESEGLVLHKDEKRVILCLLDVARFAERVGIPPPRLVQMEREIEALEANSHDEEDVAHDSISTSKSELKTQLETAHVSTEEELPLPGSDKQQSTSPPPPPPSKSDSNTAKKRVRPSRIPVRRSGRLGNMTPKALPVLVRRSGRLGTPVRRSVKGRKRRRSSDGEDPPGVDRGDSPVVPAQKRTRVGEVERRGGEEEEGKTVKV